MPQSQTPGVAPTPPSSHTPQQQQQSKEFNTASLCRLGQETVQDIVSRTQEVFQTLKTIQVCITVSHCNIYHNYYCFYSASSWYYTIINSKQ